MAYLAPFLSGISFETYYVCKLGLTKDLKLVEHYRNALKNQLGISNHTITNLNKIIKFRWYDYFATTFQITLSREKVSRNVRIEGFLNVGKVLLKDVDKENFFAIANPDEVIKILHSL